MSRPQKSFPELDKLKHLLGTIPDHEIAAKVGINPPTVGRYRRKYGIKAYQGNKFVAASPAAKTAAAPAAAVKVKGTPGRKSKIKPFHDQVGNMLDADVAAMAGVTPQAVLNYRRKHNIPLAGSSKAAPKAAKQPAAKKPAAKKSTATGAKVPGRRRSKLDPYLDLLGNVPDGEIAEKAGVSTQNVRAFRRRHKIEMVSTPATAKAAAQPAAAKPAAAKATPLAKPTRAAVPATATSALMGFAVDVEGDTQDYLVVASSITEAAAKAMAAINVRSPGARISMISLIGPAL